MRSILTSFLLLYFFYSYSCTNIYPTIVDSAKAAQFNRDYKLVIPVQDYKHMFDRSFIDTNDLCNISNIYITDANIQQYTTIAVPKTTNGSGLDALWMMPLSYDSAGLLYMSNDSIINYKYSEGIYKQYSKRTDFQPGIDVHCIVNEGDSLYYYTTTVDRQKRVLGHDTTITDFDFFTWNEKTNVTTFLFSASEIVNDSMLVPSLFEGADNALYETLDIYHWNWMQKVGPTKLLINFAFCGFMQIDLVTKNVDWYWGHNGHSFTQITGIGDLTNPYYTHDLEKIKFGPYAGYYSYFENGGKQHGVDSTFKPARSRIFSINEATNTVEIVSEMKYDTTIEHTPDIPSMALGSVHVRDNYELVNLGLIMPMQKMMEIKALYGADSALKFWKIWQHPKLYLYDLSGSLIAYYTMPYGQYCYSARIKTRNSLPASVAPITFNKGKEPKIYPNPVNRDLNISIVCDEIQILNADGDLVMKQVNTNKVYVGDLQTGQYLIKISKGNMNTTKKFVKY